MNKQEFDKINVFGLGEPNNAYSAYFIGNSYLNPLAKIDDANLFLANVTFEPGCRNNWHIHKSTKGGGQLLICTAGSGWYQEEEKDAVSLEPGSVIVIPANVKHWHGAKKDSWFSHIAVEVPGENTSNEWLEPVTDEEYDKLSGSEDLEEIFDVYTRTGEKIGTAPKSKCHSENPGFYHKPVWTWVINSAGEILIQKRSKMKKNFPSFWDMPSAGHVDSGETCIEGAIRETFEELGVKTKEVDYEYIGEYIYDLGWELAQIYLLRLDHEIEEFSLSTEEVEEVKWVKYDDFVDIFYSEKFVPLDKEYKDTICKVLKDKLNRIL